MKKIILSLVMAILIAASSAVACVRHSKEKIPLDEIIAAHSCDFSRE